MAQRNLEARAPLPGERPPRAQVHVRARSAGRAPPARRGRARGRRRVAAAAGAARRAAAEPAGRAAAAAAAAANNRRPSAGPRCRVWTLRPLSLRSSALRAGLRRWCRRRRRRRRRGVAAARDGDGDDPAERLAVDLGQRRVRAGGGGGAPPCAARALRGGALVPREAAPLQARPVAGPRTAGRRPDHRYRARPPRPSESRAALAQQARGTPRAPGRARARGVSSWPARAERGRDGRARARRAPAPPAPRSSPAARAAAAAPHRSRMSAPAAPAAVRRVVSAAHTCPRVRGGERR